MFSKIEDFAMRLEIIANYPILPDVKFVTSGQ